MAEKVHILVQGEQGPETVQDYYELFDALKAAQLDVEAQTIGLPLGTKALDPITAMTVGLPQKNWPIV